VLIGGSEGDISRYPWRWNETIGPLKDRPGRPGTWSYQNTDGLGLIEYFHWCEDLNVEPVLAVWGGMFLGTDEGHILSPEALEPWVEDTLNELEFLLGDVSTSYGALRASLGYPEPFHLKYVEIGNEDNLNNGASSYSNYRFPMFYKAISAAYPSLTIISSTGDYTAVAGSGASASWTDYHTYSRPDKLVSQFHYFDSVSREHKTLIGEYAIIQENSPEGIIPVNWDLPKYKYPTWVGAVAEAIWNIGAERNGDAVMGMSYAPGFQNLNSYEWGVSSFSSRDCR
jgi:alpha-N-arabinofuranosidase